MTMRLAILLLIYTPPAFAVELRQAPVSVTNTSTSPIECSAQLAHWFSTELGTAAPGEKLRIPLWLDPATGAYVLLNAKQDHMPVEALWCGIAGRAHATRAAIDRARNDIVCAGSERLVCD